MSLPIRPTPVLKGKDAEKFSENEKNAWNNPVPQDVYDRAKKNYEKFLIKNNCVGRLF